MKNRHRDRYVPHHEAHRTLGQIIKKVGLSGLRFPSTGRSPGPSTQAPKVYSNMPETSEPESQELVKKGTSSSLPGPAVERGLGLSREGGSHPEDTEARSPKSAVSEQEAQAGPKPQARTVVPVQDTLERLRAKRAAAKLSVDEALEEIENIAAKLLAFLEDASRRS